MPHIIQICNYTTVTNTMAEEAWEDLAHYLQGKFGLKTTDYYGGSPDFTTAARTGGRDIIFVVMLDDTPIRTERDTADRNAEWLCNCVAQDMQARGYGNLRVGVLLHHGKSGWMDSLREKIGRLGRTAMRHTD